MGPDCKNPAGRRCQAGNYALESEIVPKMAEPASDLSPRSCPRFPRCQAVVLAFLVSAGTGLLPAAEASMGATAGLANREVAKREAQRTEAQRLVLEGGMLFDRGDYTGAMKADRAAWEMLVDSPATGTVKTAARDGYSRAAIAQARKLADDARYAEARDLLNTVLEADFDPDNPEAKRLKARLDDPDRFNPALTPQHLGNVAAVNSLLGLANGLVELGDYDGAIEKFQAVLRIDRYNSAARQGMERVEKFKTDYYATARDHTRAARMAQMDAAWEEHLPASLDVSGMFGGLTPDSGGAGRSAKDAIVTKLQTWIVPRVDLQGATLDETMDFLRIRSRDLDPKHQGISFIVRVPQEARTKPITLALAHVPLDELLRYVTQMTGTAYRVDEFAVIITSLTERTTTMVSKSWRVPPDFIANAPAGDAAPPGGAAPVDPFAATTTKGAAPTTLQSLTIRRFGAREFLEQRGVMFPEGATASYNPATNILFVRNTVENLLLIDDLVEQAAGAAPKLVEVRVRMIEVGETHLNELGFDWMVGPSNVPGSNGVFTTGGTVGSGRSSDFTNTDFPFTNPSTTPVGFNPVTAGLRSSGAILGTPSIDGLIGKAQQIASDSRSPGAFTIAGVFTDPQFQVVIRALSQKKAKDTLSSPSVITKSGQRASVVIAREFIYPTEFNPPQIPTTISRPPIQILGQVALAGAVPVTPTTPTAFSKRDVGVTLEVEPVVAANNKTIEISISPSITEFDGFINYGSDIMASQPGPIFGVRIPYTQPNPVLQPIFHSNKSTSAVTIYDGATIMLSSVVTERRQDIQDKVPIVGSLPLVGRAFQSKVTQLERKNVLMFVTVRLLDPGGNPIAPTGPTTAAAP